MPRRKSDDAASAPLRRSSRVRRSTGEEEVSPTKKSKTVERKKRSKKEVDYSEETESVEMENQDAEKTDAGEKETLKDKEKTKNVDSNGAGDSKDNEDDEKEAKSKDSKPQESSEEEDSADSDGKEEPKSSNDSQPIKNQESAAKAEQCESDKMEINENQSTSKDDDDDDDATTSNNNVKEDTTTSNNNVKEDEPESSDSAEAESENGIKEDTKVSTDKDPVAAAPKENERSHVRFFMTELKYDDYKVLCHEQVVDFDFDSSDAATFAERFDAIHGDILLVGCHGRLEDGIMYLLHKSSNGWKWIKNPNRYEEGYLSIPLEVTRQLTSAVEFYSPYIEEEPTTDMDVAITDQSITSKLLDNSLPKDSMCHFIFQGSVDPEIFTITLPDSSTGESFDYSSVTPDDVKTWFSANSILNLTVEFLFEDEEYDRYIAKYSADEKYGYLKKKPSMPKGWKKENGQGQAGHKKFGQVWIFSGPGDSQQNMKDNIANFFEGFTYRYK